MTKPDITAPEPISGAAVPALGIRLASRLAAGARF